jgi:hypothetical protein
MAAIHIPDVGTVELPDYAMQHTLESLYHVMAGMSASQSNDLNALASSFDTSTLVERQTKAAVDQLQPPLENIASSSKENVRQSHMTLKQMQQGIKDANKNSLKVQSTFSRAATQVMRGAGSMLEGGGISELASLLPTKLVGGISIATKVLVKFADTQRRLTDVGMGLGTSILTTTTAVTKLNMPIFEFERVAGKYSLAIDSLGDSTYQLKGDFANLQKEGVHKGAIMFSALSNQVRKSMADFGNMGLTVTEINTYLGEYLDADRKRGVNAQRSFEGLASSFKGLMQETTAYAIDTGRNRKEMIKEQIETMSRQDTAGYSMRLRLKGEEKAAKVFSTNMRLASNEMFGRYGKSGSPVKEMILQAVMSGRGLEATEEGSNFMSLFPEAASILDTMIRGFKDKPLDPEMFAEFSVALKKGTKAYDAEHYTVQSAANVAMGIVESMQVDEKDTTPAGRLLARWAEEEAGKPPTDKFKRGADLLKGNEILVGLSSTLQLATTKFADTISGPDGLQPALEMAIKGIQALVNTLSIFAGGDVKKGTKELLRLVMENPVAQIIGLTSVGTAVASGYAMKSIFSSNMNMDMQNKMVDMMAQKNIEGAVGDKTGSIKIDGKTHAKNAIFEHEGVQYKNKNGKAEVTDIGRKTLGGKKVRVGKGTKAGSLLAASLIAWDTWESLAKVSKDYETRIKGAETQEEKAQLKKELADKKFDILGSGISRGAGSAILTVLGSVLGFAGGPLASATLAIGGSIAGEKLGQAGWEWMTDSKTQEKALKAHKANETEAVHDVEKNSPTYGILLEIKGLLEKILTPTEDTATTSRVSAVSTLEVARGMSIHGRPMSGAWS